MRKFKKYPEFNGLQKYVWEGLNQGGTTIPEIKGSGRYSKIENTPIWHNKAFIDNFVANALGLDLDKYGKDKSTNPLYKEIANELGRLRERKILVDWKTTEKRKTGVGIWRLDGAELDNYVLEDVSREIKAGNFHACDSPRTIYSRQKQHAFRKILLNQYEICLFCKFRTNAYMTGAHIVPYNVMREEEPDNAMHPKNGLLLCMLCDKAFEIGDIQVEKDMGIEISERLKEGNTTVRRWVSSITDELKISDKVRYPPDPRYFEWKKKLVEPRNYGKDQK